jgi:hypothetical protein
VPTVNALDYYGLWKLFDGVCDAAFYGKNREFALGNTAQQRFMGQWSGGTPVKKLIVTDKQYYWRRLACFTPRYTRG